jgi:tetratricopeptide (TPR) repeat protein
LNGWAWQAIGLHKIFVEGEDDLAIVALLKALRCRDIMQIRNEPLGIFYHQRGEDVNEEATVLEETGQCYRRLGRYTAAIRAFHAAIDAYQGNMTPPSSVLCSCAQGKLLKRTCNAGQSCNL